MQRPRGWAREEAHEEGKREPDAEAENLAPSTMKDEKNRLISQILSLGPLGETGPATP